MIDKITSLIDKGKIDKAMKQIDSNLQKSSIDDEARSQLYKIKYQIFEDQEEDAKIATETAELLKTGNLTKFPGSIFELSIANSKANYKLKNRNGAINTLNTAISYFSEGFTNTVVQSFVNLLITKANFLFDLGEDTECIETAKQALELSEQIIYDTGIGKSSYILGVVTQKLGDLNTSYGYLNRFLSIAKVQKNHLGMAYANMEMGGIDEKKGNLAGALMHFKTSFELYQEYGNKQQKAWSHTDLGNVYRKMGNLKLAAEHYEIALPVYESQKDERTLGNHLRSMASVYQLLGNYNRSKELNTQGLELYNSLGNIPYSGKAYQALGDDHYNLGDYNVALDHYSKAQIIFREHHDNIELVRNLLQFIIFYVEQGGRENAADLRDQLKALSNDLSNELATHAYNLADAVFSINSDSITRTKLIKQLMEYSEDQIRDIALYHSTNKFLAILLLKQHLESPSDDTSNIENIIDKIIKFGERENAMGFLVEGLILKARLNFQSQFIDDGKNLIRHAMTLTKDHNLIKLQNDIVKEYNDIL